MSDFKETCIWMSYRYAIGRKSIASVCHARDIFGHLDWIPENRRKFTAEDIYNEINDKISWSDNINMGFDGKRDIDVFSVMFEWFSQHPEVLNKDYFRTHRFDVDLLTGDVDPRELGKEPTYEYGTIFDVYSEYMDWVKLAKVLADETYLVTTEFEGVTEVKECYEWWYCDVYGGVPKLEKRYSSKGEWPNWFIAPEYIKDIKKK